MVQGEGAVVGDAMSAHPDIDMMSFTGSTRAGILVAQAAATTVKRVRQELGGKSANILLPDVDFQTAVTKGVVGMMGNSGQSCNAPTRMFVPADRQDEVKAIAKAAAERVVVGDVQRRRDTTRPGGQRGPVQQDPAPDPGRHRRGRRAGDRWSRPAGEPQSRLFRPADGVRRRAQRHDHRARGNLRTGAVDPALQDEAEAIRLANDTVYGLAAYVQSGDLAHARARRGGDAGRQCAS